MVEQLKAEIARIHAGDDSPPAMNPPPVVAAEAPAPPPPALESDVDDLSDLEGAGALHQAQARVFMRVALMLAPAGGLPSRDAKTRSKARTEAQRLLTEVAVRVPGIEPRPWANRMAAELCGLGALSAPMAEPDVTQIFVHGPDKVMVRHGDAKAEPIDGGFSCPQAVATVIHRLTGSPFSAAHPVIDARTADGANVHAIHETVATGGPQVSITLPTPDAGPTTFETLLEAGVLDAASAAMLRAATQGDLNILVCAGPGAQAFPVVAALAAAAQANGPLRQVVVRPAEEPDGLPEGTIVLQAEGTDAPEDMTAMQSLIRAALGLSPERVLVHEVSGHEAADALAALGRGLRGGVLSTRASTVQDGVTRLASLAGLDAGGGSGGAAQGGTHGAHAQYVASTFDLAVAVARFADGVSKVVQLSEPTIDENGAAATVDLALWDNAAKACNTTGNTPGFAADLERRGIVIDSSSSG